MHLFHAKLNSFDDKLFLDLHHEFNPTPIQSWEPEV